MINITNPENCCGCTACANICRHEAIKMVPDKLGFLYPVVNKDKCNNCGLCEKVCAFNDNYDTSFNLLKPIAYGARHKDMKELETSRSGAAFIALSDWILEQGGVVYGAGYGNQFRIIHKRAQSKEERNEFKGSKYVQSDLSTTYQQVRDDLKKGQKVLFTGTPCQTAGLHSFISSKLRTNLFLIDIICHGVPSPYIWQDYVSYIEKKHKAKIIKVDFRNKKAGWSSSHIETFYFDNNKQINEFTLRDLFYKHLIIRESCGSCKFTNLKRPSDITIGDFWGWEKTDKEFNKDDKGVSLLIINTPKGQSLLEDCKNSLNLINAELENILQPNLIKPSTLNPLRNKFVNDYQRKGFYYIGKKYGNLGIKYKIDLIIKKIKRKITKK